MSHEGLQNIAKISSGSELTREQCLIAVYWYCEHISLRKKKAYLLFRVRVFGDLLLSLEDNIFAIFDVITWSLTLREERRLRVLEKRMLKRVFRPKRHELTGE